MRVINEVYAVFFDTNTIKGKYWIDHTVRERATTIGDDIIIKVELYLPEVVQKEWSRYYTRHAKEQYDKIADAGAKLLDMDFGKTRAKAFNEAKVDKTSKQYLKKLGFKFVPTPHDQIDYKELVELAIRHDPPFEPSDGSDKGLKDAIIAHTITNFANKHKKSKIAFIGRDGLMTTYLKSLMPAGVSFTVFESIDAFAEAMKLKNNNLSKELTKGASEAFFIQDVNTTFYYSLNVRDRLLKAYRAKLVDAEAASRHLLSVKVGDNSDVRSPVSGGQWTMGTNKILVPDPTFERKDGDKLYWTVNLDFIQSYGVSMFGSLAISATTNYTVRHLVVFRVGWMARLTADGDLTGAEIQEVEELYESQNIKRDDPSGSYSVLKQALELNNFSTAQQALNANLSSIAQASQAARNAIGSIPASLKEVINMPVPAIPNIAEHLATLNSAQLLPMSQFPALETKPPMQGPVPSPKLDISPKDPDAK